MSIGLNRSLRLQVQGVARAGERLSSGLRINRAQDDAAGLSLSESLRTQSRGTAQAVRNAQDGISMLQLAEGAFSEIQGLLQRMRELCVQGANGVYTLADREGIQAELEALKRQIDSIAYQSSFNHRSVLTPEGKQERSLDFPYQYSTAPAPIGGWTDPTAAELLIGGPGGSVSGVSYQELQEVLVQLPSLMEGAMRKAEGMTLNSGIDHGVFATTPAVHLVIDPANPTRFTATNQDTLVVNLYPLLGAGVPPGNPQLTLQQAFVQGLADLLMQREDALSPGTGDYAAFFAPSGAYDNMRQLFTVGAADSQVSYGPPGAFQFDSLDADGGRAAASWFARYLLANHGDQALKDLADLVVEDGTGSKAAMVANWDSYLLNLTGLASRAALEADVQAWIAANPATGPGVAQAIGNTPGPAPSRLFSDMVLQVGANFGESLDVGMYAGALGNLDYAALVAVTDQATAGRSLTTLDRALRVVSQARAGLGAEINRLEATIRRLGSYEEGTADANRRIRDADMAEELTQSVRRELLVRSSLGTLQRMVQSDRLQAALLLRGLA